jgi:hypothetical protein
MAVPWSTADVDVYVDEPWLLMRWDGVHKCVHSEWKTFATSAELRISKLRGIQAIKDHAAIAYLSDVRNLGFIVAADQLWFADTWRPLAIREGLKHIAFVTTSSGFGRRTIEDVSLSLDGDELQSRIFGSVESAHEWLMAVREVADRRASRERRTSQERRASQPERRVSRRSAADAQSPMRRP